MNNDLISREALKEEFKRIYRCAGTAEQLANNMEDAIDNAPTVEPFEPDYAGAERLKARQRGYEQGYHEGIKIGKTLNPKIRRGEWIVDGHHIRCNRCKEYICTQDMEGAAIPDNFCGNCGADMRPEASNEQVDQCRWENR